MATDDSDYLTNYEAALAVVATAMKKARQRIDTLVVNSIVAGLVFSSGSMLYELVEANNHNLYVENPGLVELVQGLMYPIGLFYVVILGTDLFNANVLYMVTGLCRRAVTPLDAAISLVVSWWFNLGSTLFVCYIFCTYTDISTTDAFIKGSIATTMRKVDAGFLQTFIRGIAGNFYAALAIYLQLMTRPLHVKLLMMILPVFTFVVMGFTHSVADMYTVLLGLINGAPASVGTAVWKVFVPGILGNLVGGSFFAIVIVYYLHLVVIERDRAHHKLPELDAKDEQPQMGMDLRVRARPRLEKSDDDSDATSTDNVTPITRKPRSETLNSALRRRRASSSSICSVRSPPNVFPVAGMGPPREREASIASGSALADFSSEDIHSESKATTTESMGQKLRRAFSRSSLSGKNNNDIELVPPAIDPLLPAPPPAITTDRAVNRNPSRRPILPSILQG